MHTHDIGKRASSPFQSFSDVPERLICLSYNIV